MTTLSPPLTRIRARRVASALLFALGLAGLALAADSIVTSRASAAPSRSPAAASRNLATGMSQSYTLGGEHVALYNLAGTAVIEPGPGSRVQVTVTRVGADAGELEVLTGPIGNRQTLRVVYPSDRVVYPALGRGSRTETRVREDGTFGEKGDWMSGRRVRISGSGDGLEASADLRVSVPRGQQLTLRLAAGPVTVTNVDGDLVVDTGSGAVTTTGTRGTLDVDSGSGSVHVVGAEGEVVVDTGSGDVEVSGVHGGDLSIDTGSGRILARDIEAPRVSMDTGSGDIEASGVRAANLRFDTGSGSVEVDLASDAESVSVDTGSGDVVVRVPEGFGADIAFESGSGGFSTDLPVTVRSRDHGSFRGRVGDGSARLAVDTGSGGLRLESRRAR